MTRCSMAALAVLLVISAASAQIDITPDAHARILTRVVHAEEMLDDSMALFTLPARCALVRCVITVDSVWYLSSDLVVSVSGDVDAGLLGVYAIESQTAGDCYGLLQAEVGSYFTTVGDMKRFPDNRVVMLHAPRIGLTRGLLRIHLVIYEFP